jgi:hypothetical protein
MMTVDTQLHSLNLNFDVGDDDDTQFEFEFLVKGLMNHVDTQLSPGEGQ